MQSAIGLLPCPVVRILTIAWQLSPAGSTELCSIACLLMRTLRSTRKIWTVKSRNTSRLDWGLTMSEIRGIHCQDTSSRKAGASSITRQKTGEEPTIRSYDPIAKIEGPDKRGKR